MAAKNTFVCAPLESARDSSPEDLGSQYELIEIIGEGGMGAVWRARDRMLGIDVAIKVVPPDLDNAQAAGRLVAEARASARVRHPSAVRVLRSGISESGSPFIVMEILNGEALDEILEDRGPLTSRDACSMLLPIVSAVGAAHDQGIVHRDIKPSNIFLHREGASRLRPKLLDFGIAKQTRDVNMSMTMPGAIMGTPNYMAPEQAYGLADVDHRADVWGLCAVLYELVSNKPPFDGENYNQVLSAVLCHEPPRPDGIDDWLWAIIERGLCKEREERWGTARELGRQISGWLLNEGLEHDITHTAIRSGSMRPEAMPAAAPPVWNPSATGAMSLPPAPLVPSIRSRRTIPFTIAGLCAALGVVGGIVWLALPSTAHFAAVPRQAVIGYATAAASIPHLLAPAPTVSVEPSAAASASAPEAAPKTRVAPAEPRGPSESKRTGPGRHGMPMPTKARF